MGIDRHVVQVCSHANHTTHQRRLIRKNAKIYGSGRCGQAVNLTFSRTTPPRCQALRRRLTRRVSSRLLSRLTASAIVLARPIDSQGTPMTSNLCIAGQWYRAELITLLVSILDRGADITTTLHRVDIPLADARVLLGSVVDARCRYGAIRGTVAAVEANVELSQFGPTGRLPIEIELHGVEIVAQDVDESIPDIVAARRTIRKFSQPIASAQVIAARSRQTTDRPDAGS